MDIGKYDFSTGELPAFNIGDTVMFTITKSKKELAESIKTQIELNEFEDSTKLGIWSADEISKNCLTGKLIGRRDDYIVVTMVRDHNGKPHEQDVHNVRFDDIVCAVSGPSTNADKE